MLGLFIPWGPDHQNQWFRIGRSFSSVWEELKLTLSPRLLFHVQNFDALRRSREEVLEDRRRQDLTEHEQDRASDVVEPISDDEIENFTVYDSEENSAVNLVRRDVSNALEAICSAIDSRRGFWTRMDDLKRVTDLSSTLKMQTGEIIGRGTYFERSDGDYTSMIKEWTSTLERQARKVRKQIHGEGLVSSNEVDIEDEATGEDLSGDDNEEGAHLVPMSQPSCKSWEEARDEVVEELYLNEKQKRIIVLVAAQLSNNTGQKQLLTYLGGEGGTGKSRVIKGIESLLDKMGQKEKLQLSAASGAAADNIEGSTIHSSLGLTVKKQTPGRQHFQKLKSRWQKKEVLVIDEVSMISLATLAEIDRNCKIVKENESPFGGLRVVLLSGDFYQLPPVVGRPLYWIPTENERGSRGKSRPHTMDETRGRALWEQFSNVILLTEQMRQADDSEFHGILRRARTGLLTESDYQKLLNKMSDSIEFGQDTPIIITCTNAIRHQLNMMGVLGLGAKTGEPVYLFIAKHQHPPSIPKSRLMSIGDESSKLAGPGIFAYTKRMPIMINANIYTELGVVNGKGGRAVDVTLDPSAEVIYVGNNIYVVSQPPLCVYMEIENSRFEQLPGLGKNILPITPKKMSMEIKEKSSRGHSESSSVFVSRIQVPCCPAFAITHFRCQGRTFYKVILDIGSTQGLNEHQKFAAVYVMLSRVKSLEGLSFTRWFQEAVLKAKAG